MEAVKNGFKNLLCLNQAQFIKRQGSEMSQNFVLTLQFQIEIWMQRWEGGGILF